MKWNTVFNFFNPYLRQKKKSIYLYIKGILSYGIAFLLILSSEFGRACLRSCSLFKKYVLIENLLHRHLMQ